MGRDHLVSALDTTCDLIIEGFALLDGESGNPQLRQRPLTKAAQWAGPTQRHCRRAEDGHTTWWLNQDEEINSPRCAVNAFGSTSSSECSRASHLICDAIPLPV